MSEQEFIYPEQPEFTVNNGEFSDRRFYEQTFASESLAGYVETKARQELATIFSLEMSQTPEMIPPHKQISHLGVMILEARLYMLDSNFGVPEISDSSSETSSGDKFDLAA